MRISNELATAFALGWGVFHTIVWRFLFRCTVPTTTIRCCAARKVKHPCILFSVIVFFQVIEILFPLVMGTLWIVTSAMSLWQQIGCALGLGAAILLLCVLNSSESHIYNEYYLGLAIFLAFLLALHRVADSINELGMTNLLLLTVCPMAVAIRWR